MVLADTDNVTLHIPPEFSDTGRYQATLGHKMNHKFPPENNCRFAGTDSARFGLIMSVVTTRDVRRGEELFVNYNYPSNTNLPWYRQLCREREAAKENILLDCFNISRIEI